MIKLCPFCGRNLNRVLIDGITTCDNCNRVFDSSSYHRILSASWMIRRWHIGVEMLKSKFGLLESEIDLINEYVVDKGYTHDEFIVVLRKFPLAAA